MKKKYNRYLPMYTVRQKNNILIIVKKQPPLKGGCFFAGTGISTIRAASPGDKYRTSLC